MSRSGNEQSCVKLLLYTPQKQVREPCPLFSLIAHITHKHCVVNGHSFGYFTVPVPVRFGPQSGFIARGVTRGHDPRKDRWTWM